MTQINVLDVWGINTANTPSREWEIVAELKSWINKEHFFFPNYLNLKKMEITGNCLTLFNIEVRNGRILLGCEVKDEEKLKRVEHIQICVPLRTQSRTRKCTLEKWISKEWNELQKDMDL